MRTDKLGDPDVMVIGATPAAAAAAIRLRGLGRTVVMVHSERTGESQPELTWFGGAGMEALGDCEVKASAVGASAFWGMQLHSGDLKRSVQVKDKEVKGWIARTRDIEQALQSRVRKAGCEVRTGEVEQAVAADSHVTVRFGDAKRMVRVVLMDDGVESAAAERFRLTPAARTANACPFVWETHRVQSPVGIRLVLGPGRNLGVLLSNGSALQAGLLIRDGGTLGAASVYVEFAAALQRAGLVPAHTINPSAMLLPAGAALDMDSHVGKRSLLIGWAGGFAAAFSGDGLYPGLKSGLNAAECASRAIASSMPQDELSRYESAWRTELADYLRMPNTDLSLLMPLVFNDSMQMSRRVARAFLLGEKF